MTDIAARQRAEDLASTLPPLLVAAERVAATVAQGVHGRRRVGTGESFWQFRRYQAGDAASVIDWRQSARTDRLFVRQHEWEAAQSVWLWRDSSPSMQYRSHGAETTKADRATLLLLALSALLVRGGERVALLGDGRRPAAGGAALALIADAVTAADRDPGQSLPPREALPRHAEVVLIGDFLSPVEELEQLVRHFSERGIAGHLLQVLDPAEEDLPFTGRAEFVGAEGEGSMVAGRVEALRASYDLRLRAQREALGRLGRNARWTFTTHRTDRPPQVPLLALYESLARRIV
ncbi:MAG: DUF58 domain-containing protein [Proteobacteria bacterium]|nr:DUF58 domain-containing protein [Pseudomonadota bacterium]MDA1132864.1 DUF58 domain-containing protein [Pseudomonadota bacterium]